MKRYQTFFLHPLFIFIRLLCVSLNVNALADVSSLEQQFRVDTHIELAQFFDRNIIKFEFLKENWQLAFDPQNNQFKTISDVLQLQTSVSEIDPMDSFSLTLVENQSQCYDLNGLKTQTKDIATVWISGKEMITGESFVNQPLDELNQQGKYRNLDISLSFDPVNHGDDNCSGFIKMSVELTI